ncbi:MAG TPA: hypothetical protein VKU62_04440, partial [Thermoanaerobaculia bacterium]|nr:hypothetical protein [Thermoanaerobaculia bacterium]
MTFGLEQKSAARRLLGLMLVFASIALVSAAPSTAAPTATPSPSPRGSATAKPLPAATAFVPNGPEVIIYPFEAEQGLTPQVGLQVAQIFVQQFDASGGVIVLPVAQGVKREDYLKHARDVHADYYISGYLTPIGNGA